MNELELFGKSPADRLKMLDAMSLEELKAREAKMNDLGDSLLKDYEANKLDPKKRVVLDLLCEDLEWEMKSAIRKAEAKAENLKKAA